MTKGATRAKAGCRARMTQTCSLLFLLLAVPAAASVPGAARAGEVTVFAASSLTDALDEIAQVYEKSSSDEIRFSFASSSTLAVQIARGAPADIYVSADIEWMNYVAQKGRILTGSRVDLLGNELALVAPVNADIGRVKIVRGFPLGKLLGAGRLAMGNPLHVPAGMYGEQALKSLGVWKSVKTRVARSADVRAALALVALGAASLGIVYKTDALASDKVKIVGLFPAGTHQPVVYQAALTRNAGAPDPATRDFYRFLTSARAARIFERYGFRVLTTGISPASETARPSERNRARTNG